MVEEEAEGRAPPLQPQDFVVSGDLAAGGIRSRVRSVAGKLHEGFAELRSGKPFK